MDDIKRLLNSIDHLDKYAAPRNWATDGSQFYGPNVMVNGYMKTPILGEAFQSDDDVRMLVLSRNAAPILAKMMLKVIDDCEGIIKFVEDSEDKTPYRHGVKIQAESMLEIIKEAWRGANAQS